MCNWQLNYVAFLKLLALWWCNLSVDKINLGSFLIPQKIMINHQEYLRLIAKVPSNHPFGMVQAQDKAQWKLFYFLVAAEQYFISGLTYCSSISSRHLLALQHNPKIIKYTLHQTFTCTLPMQVCKVHGEHATWMRMYKSYMVALLTFNDISLCYLNQMLSPMLPGASTHSQRVIIDHINPIMHPWVAYSSKWIIFFHKPPDVKHNQWMGACSSPPTSSILHVVLTTSLMTVMMTRGPIALYYQSIDSLAEEYM